MSSRLTDAFIEEFGAFMKMEHQVTPNEFLQQGFDILKKHKLLKHAKQVSPKYFLVHKENRNRLMLNHLNVHKKGGVIYGIGADLKQLSVAICAELAPDGPTRLSQLEANRSMLKKFAGLLAPINGEELYLSLGCSHTMAFCKLAPLAGPTPIKELQDANGKVDYAKICKQDDFKHMIEKGWDWDVIPFDVDARFPRFAAVVQRALNGSNSASSQIGELDTAVALVDMQKELDGNEAWEQIALESVKARGMSCAEYADAILQFVKLFGGGPGAPFIIFMDSIGKKFNSTLILGKEFWHALTYTTFPDKACLFPMLRVSLALVNLTTAKKHDETAGLITKSDVARVAARPQLEKAKAYEATLQAAFEIVDGLQLSKDDVLQELGLIFVRVGILATKKGMDGPDGKDLTLQQIQCMFLGSMEKVIGRKINYPAWSLDDVTAPALDATDGKSVATPPAGASVVSLQDHNSATWIANTKGFSVGTYVRERKFGGPDFKITRVNDATSMVEMQIPQFYPSEGQKTVTGNVKLHDLLENWSIVKPKEPIQLVPAGEMRPNSLQAQYECAQIFHALQEADTAHQEANSSLTFWKHPDLVMTACWGLRAGKLVLVPVVGLASISTKKSAGAVTFTLKSGGTYYANAPARPNDTCTELDKHVVSAYFWVQKTHKADEANMEEGHITTNGIQVPVLKNSVYLKPHTKLVQYVPGIEPPEKVTSFVADAVPEPKAKRGNFAT